MRGPPREKGNGRQFWLDYYWTDYPSVHIHQAFWSGLMDDYWIIEHATDSRYVWGQWGWTDDLAAAIQFTKDDAANTPLPANARWRAITARKPPT
jgi:hypothetical protein